MQFYLVYFAEWNFLCKTNCDIIDHSRLMKLEEKKFNEDRWKVGEFGNKLNTFFRWIDLIDRIFKVQQCLCYLFLYRWQVTVRSWQRMRLRILVSTIQTVTFSKIKEVRKYARCVCEKWCIFQNLIILVLLKHSHMKVEVSMLESNVEHIYVYIFALE